LILGPFCGIIIAQMDSDFNISDQVKKRILFIITQSEFGGAQRFIFSLVGRLQQSNQYQLLVATGSDGGGEFLSALNAIGVETRQINSLKRDISPYKDLAAIFEIRRLIKQFGPNTLFLNSSKAGFVGSLASVFPMRIRPLKVIYRIGGWTFNDPWPNWKKKLWVILEKVSAHWKDFVIVNCQSDFNQAKKLKIKPRQELVLVHNGLDVYKINLLQREEAKVKIFERISKQWGKVFQVENIVGTIANFYPVKALEYFIETAQYFKNDDNIIFVIIGDGQERERLEAKIKNLGLDKKVFLLGQLANASQYLNAFDIFVLSSIKEGFSWSLLEAMSTKLPVITTDVGAAREMIENGKNGFVVPIKNPAEIARHIKEIFANDRLRQELGIQAHQTVLFKFNLDKMVSQIENLF
jgi:glycosyltransferase involved in cell wall biosynthesis